MRHGRSLTFVVACCVALAASVLPAGAHRREVRLVADMNLGDDAFHRGPQGNGAPSSLTAVGGTLYFTADDGVHGRELWKRHRGRSVLVKDVHPGAETSYADHLTAVGGALYFTADDGVHGWELWKTDGTRSGTVLVRNINHRTSSFPDELRAAGTSLYFVADDGLHGRELWRSDGTTRGTVLVRDVTPDREDMRSPSGLSAVGSTLFFMADDGVHGFEPWASDGTAAGTALVRDVNPGPAASWPADRGYTAGTAVGEALLFAADDGRHGIELWRSDGTTAGTTLVKDIAPGWIFWGAPKTSYPWHFAAVGDTLFFAADDGDHGHELWKSDGTAAGTVMVKDVKPGAEGSSVISVVASGAGVYFAAEDGVHGQEVWRSDGTAAGTQLVADVNPTENWSGSQPSELTPLGDTLYFAADDGVHGVELWRTDGTAPGTALVLDIGPGNASPTELTAVGRMLYFGADDLAHGAELWKSNGTARGTVLTEDLNTAGGSYPTELTSVGRTLYFAASEHTHGTELWKHRGDRTVMVADINPTIYEYGGFGSQPMELTAVGATLYFRADDGTRGAALWRTDGTRGGTLLVKDIDVQTDSYDYDSPSALTAVGATLFFVGNDGVHGPALWKSDGTAAGTVLVKDVDPGADWWGPRPEQLTAVGRTLYFVADDGVHGPRLWKSDGTAAGTVRVDRSNRASYPEELTAVGGTLFFAAADPAHGREVWKSNGTNAGTVLVRDVNPTAPPADYIDSNPSEFTAVGREVYFAADDGVHGRELWKTDGTSAGTSMVADIGAPYGSQPAALTAVGGRVFFAVNFGHGLELWKSDGTAAGTVRVDVVNGNPDEWRYPYQPIAVGRELYFFADDGTHGWELWRSDGTARGTRMLEDVDPSATDPYGDLPYYDHLAAVGNDVYFTADDGVHGFELWQAR